MDETSSTHSMTSHRPYLLRVSYEWIADNGMTPHLLVDATRPHVQVPAHAVKDGRIVLNVAERAVAGLQMTKDVISFSARFGGVSHSVSVPIAAVLAIYARETGQGMALPEEAIGDEDDALEENARETADTEAPAPALAAVPDQPSPDDDGNAPTPTPRRSGHLRVVK